MYRHKTYVLTTFRILSFLVSLLAIGTIIYYHGFPETPQTYRFAILVIEFSFAFYVLKYFIKIFYHFHPIEFIKSNAFEGLILLLVIFDGVFSLFIGKSFVRTIFMSIGMPNMTVYYTLFIQLYFLIIIAIEVGKASQKIAVFQLGPSALLSLSFIFIILAGAGLLMLPEMTTHGIRFIDALFTSTSACCVTGLVSVDTATCFTFKGKTIIMMLIQVGGLNIISFATFFATFYRNAAGLRYQSILKDLISSDKLSNTRHLLRKIFLFSLIIEFIGAVLLFFTWPTEFQFYSFGQKLYFSVFHSVSAFNNAGFALFTDNLYDVAVRHAYYFHLVIAGLIFFGGIGFIVIEDIFGFKNIKLRKQLRWKKLLVHSRVAINTSLILIVVGAVIFYLIEKDNTIKEYGFVGSMVTSIFQSVTCRTAGFNSVDFTRLGQPILIFMMLLMFIGASPGSTGGGIKTTTFAIILRSAWNTIRGRRYLEMQKHTVSGETINKAYSIALFSVSLIFISTFFLSITEKNIDFINLLFEEISAFGTVGLSTGITAGLTDTGKMIPNLPCMLVSYNSDFAKIANHKEGYLYQVQVFRNKYYGRVEFFGIKNTKTNKKRNL
ncbi:MAG: ATPase [Bacteroidales bacterium]|nr:ATPase [Bacteroidales bacterium]